MTAPTYTQQQQTPHLFGQTPGYDPLNPFGTSFNGGFGQQFGGPGQQQYGGQYGGGFGQQWGQQPWNQVQQWGQQGTDLYTLAWQLLGYAQQSIQLAQQIVWQHSFQQQQQLPYQMMQPRGFQRQPMAW